MTSDDIKKQILNQLIAELTAEKTVTDSQLLGVSRHYGAAAFDELKGLIDQKVKEDNLLDLFMILSYNFTPDLADRTRFSILLDKTSLTAKDISEMIKDLGARNLKATLVCKGYSEKVSAPIIEDVVARYVRNLRLDAPLSDKLKKVIGELVPEKDHAVVKAIFRDEVWGKSPWQDEAVPILYALSKRKFRIEKLNFITKFIASNHPKDLKALGRLIKEVIETYETEVRRIEKGAKNFFNEMIRENYDGTGADQRDREQERLDEQKRQLADVIEIVEDLGA